MPSLTDHRLRRQRLSTSALCVILLAGLVPSAALCAREVDTIEGLVRQIAPRIVAIEVDRDEEPAREPRERDLRGLSAAEREGLRFYFQRPAGPVTGLLLDRQGHVLTSNYNLLGDLKKVEVVLSDGKARPAKVLARDRIDDLALVKLEEPLDESIELPPLRWSEEDRFRPGIFTVAVGRSPDARNPTATLGIVSAPQRNRGRAFQTDASMNYGNSGGPVIDLDGRVLGVAAFVGHTFPHWGFNSGIGFAVRADTIREVLQTLKNGEDIERLETPLLGVRSSRDPAESGAKIEEVSPGSGAAVAGLKGGDVIVAFDGVTVEDFTHLRHLIFRHEPDDVVKVKVEREDEELEFEVKLGRLPSRGD